MAQSLIRQSFSLTLSTKQKIILKSNDLIDLNLQYSNFPKLSMDFFILKSFIYESKYRRYVTFPSLNVEKIESLDMLSLLDTSQTKIEWGNESIIKSMSEENLEDRKYKKLLFNYLKSNV